MTELTAITHRRRAVHHTHGHLGDELLCVAAVQRSPLGLGHTGHVTTKQDKARTVWTTNLGGRHTNGTPARAPAQTHTPNPHCECGWNSHDIETQRGRWAREHEVPVPASCRLRHSPPETVRAPLTHTRSLVATTRSAVPPPHPLLVLRTTVDRSKTKIEKFRRGQSNKGGREGTARGGRERKNDHKGTIFRSKG